MSKRLDQDYYHERAAWAESDEASQAVSRAIAARGVDQVRGTTASRAEVNALLLDLTAEDPAQRAAVVRTAGRPSLNDEPGSGPSPQWKVRAPYSLDADVRAIAAREGRSVSQVLRDAAMAYVAAHRAS